MIMTPSFWLLSLFQKRYEFIYDRCTVSWYRRHRAPDIQKLAMKRWDEIWTECPKPMGQHQDELISLMIRWELMSVGECRTILGLEQSQISKLDQMAKSKTVTKILRLDSEQENAENDEGANNEVDGAKTVNSMFGMQMDSDSESECDKVTESVVDRGTVCTEDTNWKPGPPSIQRIKSCDAKNRRLEQMKRTYSDRSVLRTVKSKRSDIGTVCDSVIYEFNDSI